MSLVKLSGFSLFSFLCKNGNIIHKVSYNIIRGFRILKLSISTFSNKRFTIYTTKYLVCFINRWHCVITFKFLSSNYMITISIKVMILTFYITTNTLIIYSDFISPINSFIVTKVYNFIVSTINSFIIQVIASC
jgi:hypothetical protein